MEYFLVDPNYSKRRPSYDAFLRDHFGLPNEAKRPLSNLLYSQRNAGLRLHGNAVKLDPEWIKDDILFGSGARLLVWLVSSVTPCSDYTYARRCQMTPWRGARPMRSRKSYRIL